MDSEEEEGEEAVIQLVLNRRRNQVIPMIELEASALPVFISNSNNDHSDDLAYTTPQLVGEVEIAHSFREANDSNASSGETNMVRFRPLG